MLKYSFWYTIGIFLKVVTCLFYLYCIVITILDTKQMLQLYLQHKVAMSMSPTTRSNLVFPVVLICNANQISGKMIQKWVIDNSHVSELKSSQDLSHLWKQFARIYDYELRYGYDFLNLERFLVDHGLMSLEPNASNDIQHLMMKLSRPCDKLLRSCYWGEHKQDCLKLFNGVPTSAGLCCALNHSNFNPTQTALKKTNKRSGLSVEITEDVDDYDYNIAPEVGVNVYIFGPNDYQDPRSANALDVFAPLGQETNVVLFPRLLTTSRAIKGTMRKCFFHKERPTIFGRYSYSNCLLECQLRTIVSLCKCKPFLHSVPINVKRCTFSDIPCLFKHQEKWYRIRPTEEYGMLEEEKVNGLDCKQCYPDCIN